MRIDRPTCMYKYLKCMYHTLCLIGVVILIGRCIYMYLLDEDLTSTSYKTFHSDHESIYPSINLCFGDIMIKEKLRAYGISATMYKQYLKGELFSHNLSQIPYDDVTIDPLEYLLGIQMFKETTNKGKDPNIKYFFDYTRLNRRNHSNVDKFLRVDQFNSAWGIFYKCLSFDVPYTEHKRFNWIGLVLKKSIFSSGVRPMVASGESYFSVSLSYPNQRLRYSKEKTNWNEEITNQSYAMKFLVATLEVMHFRNKKSMKCNPDWKKDDDEIRKNLIAKFECVPPYWKKDFQMDYQGCSQKKMKALSSIVSWENELKPCRIISQLLFLQSDFAISSFDSAFYNGYAENYFVVYINYPDETYKEIMIVKSFDIETLIGNGGGYLGLCLGYSLLQLPAFAFWIYNKIGRTFRNNHIDEI